MRFDDCVDNHSKRRVACDIIDDDGFVIGRAYAFTFRDNSRFIDFARNTNISTKFSADTLHFDERDFDEFEE